MKKRIFALIMAMCLALSLLPAQVFAASYTFDPNATIFTQNSTTETPRPNNLGEYFTVATDDILEVAEPVLYAIGLVTSVIYDFFLTLIVTRYDVFVRRFKKRNTNNNK